MKSFFTSGKIILLLPLFIFSFSYTYSQTVSGITGTFSTGAGNAADANGSYSPNGTINGKNSWIHVGSTSNFYIYWANSGGIDYWVLDNNTDVTDDALFFIASEANTPPSSGYSPGLIDNSSLPTLSGFSNVTISGNAGVAGATLSWTDGTAKTTTADGSGNYTISVSNGFTGTVTPSLTGYTFNPVNKSYSNITSNQTGQNYTATAITYTISGNAGIGGATLSWTDGTAKTDTADGSGNYSFTVSYNFTGTVTPSLAGYTFTPVSKSYTNVLANQTSQNYTATAITYTISGNAGFAGATLSWTDGTAKTATADGSGNYTITVSYGFAGTVTPSKTGYTFTPSNTSYSSGVFSNQTGQNYTATAITYSISGNAGVGGATLSWTDGTAKTATVDGSGNYTISVSYGFAGTVTPSKSGYTFTPSNTSYSSGVFSNQTGQNYSASAITYTISGNAGIAGATLSWTDGTAKTATADGSGNYSITVSYNFSGTVTPSLAGYTFSPTNTVYTNVLANQTNQNYTALVTISGNTTAGGVTLSWTDGTAKTTTSDGSGNYSFTVPYNWSGTVTPSLTGYEFSPANSVYTNVTAHQITHYNALVQISGNAVVAGATLSWTDGSAKSATADGSGNYTLYVNYNWIGTITPSALGYTFTPSSKNYFSISTPQTNQNYTAFVTISGNAGIAGATLSWTDGTAKTATADGSGNYSFTVSYNFTGAVTPSLAGYTFTPTNKTYTNLTANQTNQNYTALVTISGSAGIAGATLSWTDGTAKTTTSDGSGNYSFTVSYNFTGTVTPSLAGYTFTPMNKTYTNLTANQTNQNYTALVTISGNAGIAGATLSWTDGTAKTTTADGSGNYSITVSYNFSGTVTPSLTGYTFTPTSKSYTNILANQTSQNYTAIAITYTISGNTGIAGATLSWTDGSAKTATSDGSGNYTITVSYNFTGTVTPSLTGYTFSPTSKAYTNVLVNQTSQNYSATAITYTIVGNATAPGATLSWTDGTAKTATADGNGNYSITVSYNFSGTVTPSETGYSFSPVSRSYTNVLANQTGQGYSALVEISGNTGVPGATLSWTDGSAKSATADGSGNYTLYVNYNWIGTITPSASGYTFTPSYKNYFTITTPQTNQNYAALVTISGNAGIAGATLNWTDGTAKTTTADGSGNYSFTVSYNFTGTVTPSLAGYTFTPVSKTYTNITANQTNQNYTALVTISGNAGVAGATLSWTDGTAKTTTADGSGNYSFTVSYNFSGTVTPSSTGLIFTPTSKTYTNLTSNQTNQNYTALVTISGNAGIAGATLSWTDGTAKTTTADGSGNYSFTVSYNFSGTVTPSSTGFTFTPANKSYLNLSTTQTNQNYTALVTISGNAGVAGATLSWTDGTAKTTTADGSGNYSFTVSYNFSGTVTPSSTGLIFTPTSKTYTNLTANQTNQNYTPLVTVSGNTGVPGAVLSWTDGTAKTASADGSGNYSFTVSYNWTGTVTPSLTSYSFTPVNKSYSNITSNQTNQNYTALVTISGNAGIAGATLFWTDGTAKTKIADANGNYSFTVSYNFTGTVTPLLTGYTFTPTNKLYTKVLANQTNQNYTATGLTYTLSGNTGAAGATLSWTDGTAKTATADSSGNYSITVSYNFTGTVTPSLSGYTFTPASKSYTTVLANQINQNYTAAAITFTISGNTGTGGAILSWTDGSIKTDTSDSNGNYSFSVSYNWSGKVSILKTGYTFNPASKSYTTVLANQINQNYTAAAITFTISGNTGTGGATLSWTDGTPKTATSDSSGNYTFAVSYNFSGTITPSKTGYTFTPANKAYSNLLVNQVNQNYAASAITYTISGNTVVDSVTVSWIDGTQKTAISDSSGNYLFTVSYNWSGNVTPSKTGFSFNPVNKNYTGILSNQLNQNYLVSISSTPIARAAIQITDSSFTASWDSVTGVKGYKIDVATDSNFINILSKYDSLNVDTNLAKTISGLNSGTRYYYRVRGYYRNLVSSNSNIVSVSTSLNTPTNLTAVYDSLGIQLNWNYNFNNSNVVGFVIFREGGPGSLTKNSIKNRTASLLPYDTANGNVTTYLDKNVVEGYTYNYSVSAYNLSGIISSIGGTVTAPVVVPLKSPVDLLGIVQPGGKIVLFWKNKSTTEDGFIIERSAVDSTNFNLLAKIPAIDTTYTDSTAQSGIKYFYRVAAYRDTIVSSYSNTISLVNIVTGTTDLLSGMPKAYKLYQNYPNPFNPTTQIRIALPKESHVNITIFNVLGSVVEKLYEGELNAGYHEIQFNAGRLSSGIYIYRMTAGTYSQVLKMVLLK